MEDSKRNQSIKERMQQRKGALTGKIKLKRKSDQKPVSLSSQTKVLPSYKTSTEDKEKLSVENKINLNKVSESKISLSDDKENIVKVPLEKKSESINTIEKTDNKKEKENLVISKNKSNDSIIVSRPKVSPVSNKKSPTTYSFKKGSAPPPPMQVPTSDGAKDFSNKKKKDVRGNKKDSSIQENTKFFKQGQKKIAIKSSSSVPKEISIMENIQVSELAKKMNLRPNEIIAKLMKMGTFATINNVIDSDTATLIASEYNCSVKIISLYEQTLINSVDDLEKDLQTRPPVVTIMGHVDHGKTKLLDVIRRSAVIDNEAGGITQHIGAYQVQIEKGSITFLDTPGHEAFTSMRARGASVTDIVVLVVAANDGVMPQTIEAINHAKEAKVPIIVAINKIDIPGVKPEKIVEELASHGLQPEDWGGDTIICKISAKENIGISELLEMILLKAETMDLKANPSALATGIVIESKLDVGKGASITVLVQNGTLKIGDPFVAGVYSGRVRAIFNDIGSSLKKAGLSYPVQIIGSSGLPTAGSPFNSLKDEKQARQISKNRQEYEKIGANKPKNTSTLTIDNMTEVIKQGSIQELKIVIKADVDGSKEAIKNSIEKLSTDNIKLNVIHSATGAIIDSDVILAKASNAIIVGFNVKANSKVSSLAQKEQVEINYYSIIYDLIDSIRDRMEGMLEPEVKEESMGELEVREIFKISKLGNIAGCFVTDGRVNKSFNVKVFRDNEEIFNGKIKNLKRLKEDVNQVENGFECGLLLDGFNDLKAGDRLEVFKVEKVKRKL